MSNKLPEFVYIVRGIGAGESMSNIVVDKYKVKRATPKRLYVFSHGGEFYFTKTFIHMYTSMELVESALRNEKGRRLAAAKRLVVALEVEQPIPIQLVPPSAPDHRGIKL